MKEESLCPSLVVTNPDKPVGRKQTITPTPVKKWAEENKIEVLTPEKITPDFISVFKEKNMDLSVVIAYGKILPEELINIPKYGTINVHFSLLPRHRGATPVEATILSGDTEAGVTIQQMVFELDAGDILNEEKIQIKSYDTKESLFNSLSEIGATLLIKTIKDIAEGKSEKKPQDDSLATFSKRIKKADGEITDADTEEIKWRKYRAYTPWPRTFFFKNEKRFVITEAVFENSKFVIKKVIPEGGKEIPYSENF